MNEYSIKYCKKSRFKTQILRQVCFANETKLKRKKSSWSQQMKLGHMN